MSCLRTQLRALFLINRNGVKFALIWQCGALIDGLTCRIKKCLIDVLIITRNYGLQISQDLGPDGDHRDEQRQRGERGNFLD